MTTMLLENKNAVIYGGGGAVGGAVARAFAREGARVYIAGRSQPKLDAVAQEIVALGGKVETSRVNALDAAAVEQHMERMIAACGSVDISFNIIGLDDIQGAPLITMAREQFTQPIFTTMEAHFTTTIAAARQMVKQGSGVILALTAQAGRQPYPNTGGFGVACAAIEGLYRQLAAELGPHGIRAVCLRSSGSPDAPGVDEVFHLHAQNAGISRAAFETKVAERTLLKRLPKLAEVANAAVLMASDYASAVTATVANVTCGEIVD